MDNESYIIKPKDPSAIVRLQDPTVIEQILENPLAGGAPFLPRANILIRGCPTLSRFLRKGGPG